MSRLPLPHNLKAALPLVSAAAFVLCFIFFVVQSPKSVESWSRMKASIISLGYGEGGAGEDEFAHGQHGLGKVLGFGTGKADEEASAHGNVRLTEDVYNRTLGVCGRHFSRPGLEASSFPLPSYISRRRRVVTKKEG
jgi:hypothetical protein